MALAGLWEGFKWPDGTVLRTFTIMTTNANEMVGELHNRMPVILPRAAEAIWLDRTIEEAQKLLPLLVPYSDNEMAAYEVSLFVNSPRNDSPACIEPA